jgi:SAM-dependent methyltransferase
MNAEELRENPLLSNPSARVVQDLNENPVLPSDDNTFDFVLMQLTVDYLVRPVSVFKAVSSVLKPGGTFAVTFSDRVFMSKQVGIWSGKDDFDHIMTVVGYAAKSTLEGGEFDIEGLVVRVLSDGGGGRYDPLFAVEIKKKA